jgi:hypothetical protein
MRTATNRGSRWLFPGRRAGQPLHPEALSALIHDLGVPTTAGRAAAIRQHVLDIPAPIVATALGYHQVATTRLATDAGTTWARYAPRRLCKMTNSAVAEPDQPPTTKVHAGGTSMTVMP